MDRGTLKGAFRILLACVSLVIFSNCGGSPSATQLVLNWDANHESGVNSAGGGYRVYYAFSPGVNTSTASFMDVPYVSGSQAPTTVTLTNPSNGTYYFRIVAYSTFSPPNGSTVRRSNDSTEISVGFP
jgi:hypothetical protein